MTDRIGVSKSSPTVSFYLEADVLSYNVAGNYATLVCYLRSSKSTGSFYNNYGAIFGHVNGVGEFGSYGANPFLPSSSTGWRLGPYYINVPMWGATTYGLTLQLRYGNVNTDHGGSIWIPWAPQAPTGVAVDQPTPTSLRYRFSGNGDNGSAITGWQAQIATDAAFTTGVQTVNSGGTTTFTDLSPATMYWFRSRGVNGVGWGPWSSSLTGMTDSGAYVSKNGIWVGVPVYVSSGTAWGIPELLISDGTTWEEAI